MNDITSKCGRFNAHVISWVEKQVEISGKSTVDCAVEQYVFELKVPSKRPRPQWCICLDNCAMNFLVSVRCPITWLSLYYKQIIPKWSKGQCLSMSRWSEPWVDKCYVLWCPSFHMFNHDIQLVHVDEWWEPLSDAECEYDDRRDVTEMG